MRGAANDSQASWDDLVVSRDSGPFAVAMSALETRLRDELRGLAAVTREQSEDGRVEGVHVQPLNPRSVDFSWIDRGDRLLSIGRGGNRWELDDDVDSALFAAELASSVVDGRVWQVSAPARSHLVVTLSDGTQRYDTTYALWRGLLHVPGWKRRATKIVYEPYAGPLG